MMSSSEGFVSYELAQPSAYEPAPAIGLLNLADQTFDQQSAAEIALESEHARASIKNQALFLVRHLEQDVNQSNSTSELSTLRQIRLLTIAPWCDYLLSFLHHHPHISSETADCINYLTATILELVESDVIRETNVKQKFAYQRNGYTFRSCYSRDNALSFNLAQFGEISNKQFFATNELRSFLRKLKGRHCADSAAILDSVTEKNSFPLILESTMTSLTELQTLQASLATVASPIPRVIHIQMELGDQTSVWIQLAANGELLAFQNSLSSDGIPFQASPLSSLEIWEAILHLHQKLTPHEVEETEVNDRLSQLIEEYAPNADAADISKLSLQVESYQPLLACAHILKHNHDHFNFWQRRLARKRQQAYIFRLANAETHQLYISEKLAHHYRQLLFDPDSQLSFCKSGQAANMAALKYTEQIHQLAGNYIVKCYQFQGWYYESKPPAYWRQTCLGEANTLLISAEPNSPCAVSDDNTYFDQREAVITAFFNRAAAEPSQQFVMVFDKTNDPLHKQHLVVRPSNVVVIDTASLTKHQRGLRHQFAGIVSATGVPDTIDLPLDEAVFDTLGRATVTQLESWPLLTSTEVCHRIEKLKTMVQKTKGLIDELQKDLPQDQRWQFQAYSFFGFLLPPSKILDRYMNTKDNDQHKALECAPIILGDVAAKATHQLLNRNQELASEIERGESYGLEKTRISLFFTPDISFPNEMVASLRISFGTKTPPEATASFVSQLMPTLVAASEHALSII